MVNKKEFRIYMVTCLKSGKRYIGITSQTVEKRWARHCAHANKGDGFYLHRAIRKHGRENFKVEQIGAADSRDEACDLERSLIAQYSSFGEGGYNLTQGGEGASGRVVNDAERELRSRRAKGQWAKKRPEMIASLRVAWSDAGARDRLRQSVKAASERADVRLRRSAAMKARFAKPEEREKVKKTSKERANRPEERQRQRQRMRDRWADSSFRESQSEAMKKSWSDPVAKEKWRESLRRAWARRKAGTNQEPLVAAS